MTIRKTRTKSKPFWKRLRIKWEFGPAFFVAVFVVILQFTDGRRTDAVATEKRLSVIETTLRYIASDIAELKQK